MLRWRREVGPTGFPALLSAGENPSAVADVSSVSSCIELLVNGGVCLIAIS